MRTRGEFHGEKRILLGKLMEYTSRGFIPRLAGGPVTVVASVVLNIPFFQSEVIIRSPFEISGHIISAITSSFDLDFFLIHKKIFMPTRIYLGKIS